MANKDKYGQYRIPPPPQLSAVFSHFYFAANRTATIVRKTFLPSYQTILVFNFGTPISFITQQHTEVKVEECMVIGPVKKAFDYELVLGSEILVVNFKDDAFSRFLGQASIPNSESAHPDELVDEDCFSKLWTALSQIEGTNKRIGHICEFCRPYLSYRGPLATKIANFHGDHLNPIKAISEENKVTERTVQLNHKKHLGFSAKELNRYQRFLKAIEVIQRIASCSILRPCWSYPVVPSLCLQTNDRVNKEPVIAGEGSPGHGFASLASV